MRSAFFQIIFTVTLIISPVSFRWAFSQEDLSGLNDDVSREMSGNKLFVHTVSGTYSFAPNGEEMLRIGFHRR